MTTADLDALVLRANRAGHNSIAEYALALERDKDYRADRFGKLAFWLERDRREPDKVILYAQEVRRLSCRQADD